MLGRLARDLTTCLVAAPQVRPFVGRGARAARQATLRTETVVRHME